MASKRAQEFIKYLTANALMEAASPTYTSLPNLRKRGLESSPNLQARQYAAPTPARAEYIGMSQNRGAYDPIADAMSRVPINIQDPSDTVANQWLVGTNPDIAAQVAGNNEEWLQKGMAAFLNAAATGGSATAETLSDIPVFQGPSGYGTQGITQPGEGLTVGDVTTGPVSSANMLYSYGEQQLWEMQINDGITMATGGDLPWYSKAMWLDLPGTGKLPEWAPLNAQATDIWYLPNWLDAHPEDRLVVQQIVADAEAQGIDPTVAVGEWWADKQGFVINLASRAITDPVNLAGGLGWLGRGARGAAETRAAISGPSKLTRTMEVGGQLIEVPSTLIDAPWEISRALRRRNGWGQVIPDTSVLPETPITEGGLLSESTGSQVRTAEAQVENLLARGGLVDQNPNLSAYTTPGGGATGPVGPTPNIGGSPGTIIPPIPGGPMTPAPGSLVPPGGAALTPPITPQAGPLGPAYQHISGLLQRPTVPATMTDLDNIPRFDPVTGTIIPETVGPTSELPAPRPVEMAGPTSAVSADIELPRVAGVPRAIYYADTLAPNEVLPDVPTIITPSQTALPEPGAVLPTSRAIPTSPDEVFDEVLPGNGTELRLGPEYPENVRTAWDTNMPVLADPARAGEIPTRSVPLNSRIVATQDGFNPDVLQRYIDDPASISETSDMPIAIRDGDTYYVVEGTHRTGAARVRGDKSITMRVIDATDTGPAANPLPIETGAPTVPVPARDVADPATLVPVSYTMDGAPSGLITTGPVDMKSFGWSMKRNVERGADPFRAYVKEQADTFPEQVGAVDEAMTPWMTTFFEPNYNNAKNMNFAGPPGMNNTMKVLLEGEASARYRLAFREQGIPGGATTWRKSPERQMKLSDRIKAGTAKKGEDWDKTDTLERYLEDYLFDREIDPKVVAKLKRDRVFVENITDFGNRLQIEGHWRWNEAQRLRRILHASDSELDAMLGKVDVTPQPEPLTEAQVQAIPTADVFHSRQYGAVPEAATRVLEDMGEEAALPVIREVAPWAETAYRGYDLMPRPAQVMTDLEYAGRLRVAAMRAGHGDIGNLIPAYGNANSLDEMALVDYDGYEVVRNLSDERARYAYNFEALGDYENVLEGLGFSRGDRFRAKVESIRNSNRVAKAGKTGMTTPIPKAVYTDKIGLKGWVFEGGDNLQDAIRTLDRAGVPKIAIGGKVSAREADRLINPTEDLIHRAIVGSEEQAREARNMLYKRDDVPFFSNPPTSSATDPAALAWERRGYDLHQQIYATRTMLRGQPAAATAVADNYGRALVRSDWQIEMATVNGKPGFAAVNPVTGQVGKEAVNKATVQNWINKFPETDDGTWLTAPECFI